MSGAGTLLAKGAVKLFHGAKKDFKSFDSKYATETAFGKGFSFTPDKKVAESYAKITPFELKKLYGKKYLDAAIERKKEGEPLLYQVEANLKDNETLIVRKNFDNQNEQVQKKLKTLIEKENINIDDLDLDKPKFWRQILKATEKDADELFSKYGIKGSIKDARGSSIKQVGGELEYTIYDPSIIKIINKTFLDKNKKNEGDKMKKTKRTKKAVGSVAQEAAKGADSLLQAAKDDVNEINRGPSEETLLSTPERKTPMPREQEERRPRTLDREDPEEEQIQIEQVNVPAPVLADIWFAENTTPPQPEEVAPFENAVSEAVVKNETEFEFNNKMYNIDEEAKSKIEQAEERDEEREQFFHGSKTLTKNKEGTMMVGLGEKFKSFVRQPFQEGGMPVDTYPNIPPEEMEAVKASQLPDDVMEEKHEEFIIDEALNDRDQDYLMEALEQDPKLSTIFDRVMDVATEFSGAGTVKGMGTGTSDSIPARLSDGEFVFTAKSVEELGADNLQMLMDNAERSFDQRQQQAVGGMMQDSSTSNVMMNNNQNNIDKELNSMMIQSSQMQKR